MTELRTDRLLLRPLEEADAEALHEFWTEPQVRLYLFDDVIIPPERVREIISSSRRCFIELGCGFFSVRLATEPERLIGFCGFRRFEDGSQPELLYGIQTNRWGKGYGTEAAREVLRHGFEACAMERIIAATDTPNQRSVQVMQRLGMIFEQRREYHGLDTVFYGISKAEFQSQA